VKGRDYLYFRAPSGKLTSLPTDKSSAEFRNAYDACIRALQPKTTVRLPHKAAKYDSTVNAAIDKYMSTAEFAALNPKTTLRGYMSAIKGLRESFGTAPLRDLDSDSLEIYTEQVAKENGASVADRVLIVVNRMWRVARKYEQFDVKKLSNPTQYAEHRYKIKRAHRPWPHEVFAKVHKTAPANVQLAMDTLLYSAQRGGDCIRIEWTDFDGRGLLVRPEKTNGEAEAEANYHLCPRPLLEALRAAPRQAHTILVNELGKPYANSGVLSNAIARALRKAKIEGFTMHGLRKMAAREVAALGVGVAGIKSVTGHRSNEMAEYYARGADMRAVNQDVKEKWDLAIERKLALVGGTDKKAS
jgi:integrase